MTSLSSLRSSILRALAPGKMRVRDVVEATAQDHRVVQPAMQAMRREGLLSLRAGYWHVSRCEDEREARMREMRAARIASRESARFKDDPALQQVVEAHGELSYVEIGEVIGVSEVRARQICVAAMQRVRDRLGVEL